MRSLAIIPARGGSKRIPGKNLCDVGGRGLVALAIESAKPCDMVVVSTDDPKIAEHVGWWGTANPPVSLHQRQPEHATDDAQIEPVIADVLASIDRVGAETHGIGIDAIVLLQPTSPFRTAAHVAEALALLAESGADAVVSVTALHSLHPAFNGNTGARWEGKDTRPSDRYCPRELNMRPASSTLGHLVYENGAIYAFTRKHWNKRRNRGAAHRDDVVLGYRMHWSEAIDVDTPEDLEAARRMAR